MKDSKHKNFHKLEAPKKCPYCGGKVVLTDNAELYGASYGNGKCYLCRNCKASVGVHPDLVTPLGILANAELRYKKLYAHKLFDPYWKDRKMSRITAYRKLASRLGIQVEHCHFGWFDNDMIDKAIAILEKGL